LIVERGEAEADKTVKMQKMKHFVFRLENERKEIETVAVGGTAGRWCRPGFNTRNTGRPTGKCRR